MKEACITSFKMLKVGKQMRSLFRSRRRSELAWMLWQISQWIFADTLAKKIPVRGNSEINRKVSSILEQRGL